MMHQCPRKGLGQAEKGDINKGIRVPNKYCTHFPNSLGLILVITSSEVVATYTSLSSS